MDDNSDIKKLEKTYTRNVDTRLTLPVSILYLFAIINRNTLGYAKLNNLEKDIGLHDNQFNWIMSVFFISYIIFAIPSNYIMTVLGPSRWISLMTTSWSACLLAMAFSKSFVALLLLNLMMGAAQAGLVPGFVYLCGLKYSKSKQAPRITIFYSAGVLSGVIIGPLCAGLSKVSIGSLYPHQSMLLIQGIISMGLGIVCYFIIENDLDSVPDNFQQCEQLQDDPQASKHQKDELKTPIWAIFFDGKLWLYGILFLGSAIAGMSQAIFTPTLIEAEKVSSTLSQVLSAIPALCGLMSQWSCPFILGAFPHVGLLVALYSLIALVSYILLVVLSGSWVRLGLLCLAQFGVASVMPWSTVWMTRNTIETRKQRVGSGIISMSGGLAGIIGSHIYPNSTSPHFRPGNIVNCAFQALGIVLALFMHFFLKPKTNSKR